MLSFEGGMPAGFFTNEAELDKLYD